MKIRLCLITGIFGIAVIAGVMESLMTHKRTEKDETGESAV
jgi:hypothetical protein